MKLYLLFLFLFTIFGTVSTLEVRSHKTEESGDDSEVDPQDALALLLAMLKLKFAAAV